MFIVHKFRVVHEFRTILRVPSLVQEPFWAYHGGSEAILGSELGFGSILGVFGGHFLPILRVRAWSGSHLGLFLGFGHLLWGPFLAYSGASEGISGLF